ncbi:MAG: VCBS repeat-containing protein, partial [Planctomycetes bacterium]|nr:VCBS repeat-containing protein [Planctomycetota bacterium]
MAGTEPRAVSAHPLSHEYAQRHLSTGQEILKWLKGLEGAILDKDTDFIAEHFDEHYAGEGNTTWTMQRTSERDGVTAFEVVRGDPSHFNKRRAVERFVKLLADQGRITKCKFAFQSLDLQSRIDTVTIRCPFSLRGTSSSGRAFHTVLAFVLELKKSKSSWKIINQELEAGRTVRGDRTGFTDITADAGIDLASRPNPLFDTPDWHPGSFENMIHILGAGAASADYDNDGWYDVLLVDGVGLRLFRNLGNGRFQDATAESGLPTELLGATAAVFADFDNDADKDLFVGCFTGQNRMFRNDGRGSFTDVTASANVGGLFVTSAAAADYD